MAYNRCLHAFQVRIRRDCWPPNAGKSTLVNTLVGQKVAIVSPKPQTTRNRIQGILNRDDAQIVLVDTPGIHRPENVLSRMMMDELQHALEGIDILSLIVDATADFGARRPLLDSVGGTFSRPGLPVAE
jgi:GTP-binding protein Era